MKLFLFLMLFSFAGYAQTNSIDYAEIVDIVNQYSPSVFRGFDNSPQVYSPVSPYCVEDNWNNCVKLGYTLDENDLKGREDCVACPFDVGLFNCPKWTCNEVGLLDFEEIPEGMDCMPVKVPGNVKDCYQCFCGAGYINYSGCEGLIAEKTGRTASEDANKEQCKALGFKNSVTECADYVVCPLNPNRVRCLDVVTCQENEVCPDGEEPGSSLCTKTKVCNTCEETGCVDAVEVPENAEPDETEQRICSCQKGDNVIQKTVVLSWKCKAGYRKILEGGKYRCISVDCNANENEFEGPDATTHIAPETYKLDDCYRSMGNTAPGWKKEAVDKGDGKVCYKCKCELPANCKFVSGNAEDGKISAGAYGKLEGLCCDGKSYASCEPNCPDNVYVPDFAIGHETECNACGKKRTYIGSWECETGYIPNGNRCDVQLCSDFAGKGRSDGTGYYDIEYNNYTSAEGCKSIVAGEGWVLYNGKNAQGICNVGQSGQDCCGLCFCPNNIEDGPNGYKYALSDTDNSSHAVYKNLGCNGKYQRCEPTIDGLSMLKYDSLQIDFNEAVGTHYAPFKICGERYYKIQGCNEGYTLAANGLLCEPNDCSDYKIAGQCPTHGHCDTCTSAGVTTRKLVRCDARVNGIEYAKNDTETECCQKTCDPEDDKYIIGSTCPEGKTLDDRYPVIENGCHETCVRCI
ncbi:MAG: hypothetical protein J5896_00875 [Alphaproteobacteria bacterium]|nr:hypothetical protein [Alphaproteobacteria bacterium]